MSLKCCLALGQAGLGEVGHGGPVVLHGLEQRLPLLLGLGHVDEFGDELDPLDQHVRQITDYLETADNMERKF